MSIFSKFLRFKTLFKKKAKERASSDEQPYAIKVKPQKTILKPKLNGGQLKIGKLIISDHPEMTHCPDVFNRTGNFADKENSARPRMSMPEGENQETFVKNNIVGAKEHSASPTAPKTDGEKEGYNYQIGDYIGNKYEVYEKLGKGGCGEVYLVYSHETKEIYALKTVHAEPLQDDQINSQIKNRFRREAEVWVKIESHSYIVRAFFVDEIEGRLCIAMEYINPDEKGMNTLKDYFERKLPNLALSFRWAIQFCYGMEYACTRGIRCHRDIKPSNIMISFDKTLKITDFGLAGVVNSANKVSGEFNSHHIEKCTDGCISDGAFLGTPGYMAPEQEINPASCDERSDIYSFGIVLSQMATGGQHPQQITIPKSSNPLFPIIHRCLAEDPNNRYFTFKELRNDLEPLLKNETGEVITPPELRDLHVWELANKGTSLAKIGRYDEGIACLRKALEKDPHNAGIWNNMASILNEMGCYDEAIHCCHKAIKLEPQKAAAWYNQGNSYRHKEQYIEAVKFYDKALKFEPEYVEALNNKGMALDILGRYHEAMHFYDKALKISPRCIDAWDNKGDSFCNLGCYKEAIICFDEALKINPHDTHLWNNKGTCFDSLGLTDEGIRCYDRALEIDPINTEALTNKGLTLIARGKFDEAGYCLDKALEIDPQYAPAIFNKALLRDRLGRINDAVRFYRKFLGLASAKYAPQIEHAHRRLTESDQDRRTNLS